MEVSRLVTEHAWRADNGRVVKDATAALSDEFTHAALDVNIPSYADAILTTDAIVDSISSLKTLGVSA